jgi:hypothetical protein
MRTSLWGLCFNLPHEHSAADLVPILTGYETYDCFYLIDPSAHQQSFRVPPLAQAIS